MNIQEREYLDSGKFYDKKLTTENILRKIKLVMSLDWQIFKLQDFQT